MQHECMQLHVRSVFVCLCTVLCVCVCVCIVCVVGMYAGICVSSSGRCGATTYKVVIFWVPSSGLGQASANTALPQST